MNQTLIAGLGAAFDGTDPTLPLSEAAVDAQHANQATCFECHRSLDPMRQFFRQSYSLSFASQGNPNEINLPGMFAFNGVSVAGTSIYDLATNMAASTKFSAAWTQKLCTYFNSAPCDVTDPEFARVAAVFANSNYAWRDNHGDAQLAAEVAATQSGVQTIASLMTALQAAALQDQVTFALFNVFGRTMSLANKGYLGRDHNANHNAGILIGKGVKGSVIGGLGAVGDDYGALSINPQTGAAGGTIAVSDSLAAFGKTLGGALGLTEAQMDPLVSGGQIVSAALNTSV